MRPLAWLLPCLLLGCSIQLDPGRYVAPPEGMDAGRRDATVPDASTRDAMVSDAAMLDAQTTVDAQADTGVPDAQVDAGPNCPNLEGPWMVSILPGCPIPPDTGSIMLRQDAACSYSASGDFGGALQYDGATPGRSLSGSVTFPAFGDFACTGNRIDATLVELNCGGCEVRLNPA